MTSKRHFVLPDWNCLEEPELCHLIEVTVAQWGICILPGFFSKDFCRKAISDIKRLERANNVKIWQDPIGSDKRIMGIGAIEPYLELRYNRIINKVMTSLYGKAPKAGFTMSGHLQYVQGNLGSGQGWHRDSVNVDQFKAIAYLSDVTSATGPFQYYLRTASERSIRACEKCYGIPKANNRISVDPQKSLPHSRLVEVLSNAGALLFANTRAIHRGKPIEQGQRFALTTYFWERQIPEHIMKYVN